MNTEKDGDRNDETGVRPAHSPEDATKLDQILNRMIGFGEVAEENRSKLTQLLRENSQIAKAIEENAEKLREETKARDDRLNESLNRITGALSSLETNQDILREQVQSLGTQVQLLSDRLDLSNMRQDALEKQVRDLTKAIGKNGETPKPSAKG